MFFFCRRKTVDGAIAPLLTAQAELLAVFDERTDTIDRNHQRIAGLNADTIAAQAERTRAAKIRDALIAITEPKE